MFSNRRVPGPFLGAYRMEAAIARGPTPNLDSSRCFPGPALERFLPLLVKCDWRAGTRLG